jgi:hypothetical protein
MRFCFCEDATALQRRDHIENKVIRRFAARHTFLFVFKWSGRNTQHFRTRMDASRND